MLTIWSFARLIAPVVTTTSVILSSSKIQNGYLLVPANPDPSGKWLLKWREKCISLFYEIQWVCWLLRHAWSMAIWFSIIMVAFTSSAQLSFCNIFHSCHCFHALLITTCWPETQIFTARSPRHVFVWATIQGLLPLRCRFYARMSMSLSGWSF